MTMPIPLGRDFDVGDLRRLARSSKDANQARRLLALATIQAGGTRSEAAAVGGVGRQIVRDWVVRFNAEGPRGLLDRKAPGQPARLEDEHRRALAELIEAGPIPAVHGVVRWRLVDLVQWIWDEFRITVSETTVGRVLRTMGYRKLSARPRHRAQDPEAAVVFKKTSPTVWRRSRGTRRRASAWKSGSPTRPGSVRRTRSHGAGPGAAPGRSLRATSGPNRSTSSARSVRPMARRRGWSCPRATPRR